MASPDDRKYAESHEWHKLDGAVITVGLTRFAVDELTDLTFLELPEVGATFNAGDAIGEVESVKTTSEVYTGVAGKITEVNQKAVEDPAIVNNDPFGDGWLFKIEPSDPAELDALLDAAAYDERYPAE